MFLSSLSLSLSCVCDCVCLYLHHLIFCPFVNTPLCLVLFAVALPNVNKNLVKYIPFLFLHGFLFHALMNNFTQYLSSYPATCTCTKQRGGWRKLASPQTQALVDVVARLDQGPVRGAEDPKARRRRLYRLASEERPAFPVQQKNFYNHVMENKEVMKMLSLLSTCTQNIKLVREYCSSVFVFRRLN